MAYSQPELNKARREAQAEAKRRPAKKAIAGGDGVLQQRFHPKAYWNAVVNHGVDPNDSEYWNDMARIYPESQVAYSNPSPVFSFADRARPVPGRGRRTRFGRATFSKRYS